MGTRCWRWTRGLGLFSLVVGATFGCGGLGPRPSASGALKRLLDGSDLNTGSLFQTVGVEASVLQTRIVETWGEQAVTIFAVGESASLVLARAAAEGSVELVCPADLPPITCEFSRAPVRSVLRAVAAMAGRAVVYVDGVARIEEGDQRGDAVRVVRGREEWVGLASSVMSALGVKPHTVGDSLVLVGDLEDVERAAAVAEEMDGQRDGWLLQVCLLQVSEDARRELGLDLAFTGRAGVGLGGSTGVPPVAVPSVGVSAGLVVQAIARAADSGRKARVGQVGTLMLLEGREASLQVGDTTPVARRTVSDQGTVTVSGFDQVRSGFNITARGRRTAKGIELHIAPSISRVTGFVEGAPVLSERRVEVDVVLASGEWVILGGLDVAGDSNVWRGVPGWSKAWQESSMEGASTMLAVRAVRVSAGG